MKFSPQQADAIDAVAEWFKRHERPIFRVFGYAGTGKTTLARHFAASVKGSVQYAAFTGKAAMVMKKNGCTGASTIHSLIYKFEQDEETGITRFRLRPRFELEKIKLFVIDECSMVYEELGKDLLSYGIPILVLGDPGQLPPVNGGGFFTNHDPDVMLEEIHRQAADNPIVRLATDVREGRRLERGDYGAVRIISPKEVDPELVTGADQVLVGVNRTRQRYNARLRQIAGFKAQLPEVGDRLVALKNDHALGILNGGLWEVLELKPRRRGAVNDHCLKMIVKSLDFQGTEAKTVRCRQELFLGKGDEVGWKELRGTQQFDFGYALTVHKAQGSQWGNVCLFDESHAFPERGRHLYTGITRAAERLTIVA
ncbi:ATP-dependent DNA helicase [Shinella zoogloeoides]|uniref:ATP-dependent DNA helicase n=1 Tax=Shinella zoogloeoides TaxID=352475 RepID=UPI00299DDE7A|nr:AAA family ATPase [Shinella zoogloeoides]WPE19855.1 ATP-dependent RecD-like DNA helicase [Shinella zoogloeoides]